MTINFGKWFSPNFISEIETSMEKLWIMIKSKNGTSGNQFNEVRLGIRLVRSEAQDEIWWFESQTSSTYILYWTSLLCSYSYNKIIISQDKEERWRKAGKLSRNLSRSVRWVCGSTLIERYCALIGRVLLSVELFFWRYYVITKNMWLPRT